MNSSIRRLSVISISLFALVPIVSSSANAQPPILSGYQIRWYDDFDDNLVDESKWTRIFSTNPTNNSLQAYLPQQVTESGGHLVMTSENVPYGNLLYRSGQVFSTTAEQYGRWEVRADLPTSRGMWPAIWLLPDTGMYPWPSQGEIDIMENRGDQPSITSSAFHYGTNPPYVHNFVMQQQQTMRLGSLVDYHDGFHKYAVEWDPDQIRFYVDDVHYYTVTDSSVDGFLSHQAAGMQLIINTAIGGDFLDDPDQSTIWPQQFLIDYVYAYTRTGPPIEKFDNGDFEVDNSLAHWTVFGNRWPNVSAENAPWSMGQTSAKIFGQYTGNDNYSGIEQGISVSAGDSLRAAVKTYIGSDDSINHTSNSVRLKIDYYRKPYGIFGSADYISSDDVVIADASSPNDIWQDHELVSTVPPQAQSARVAIVFQQPSNQSGSVYVDDIVFVNLSDEDRIDVPVEMLSIIRGIQTGGDVSDLGQSNDTYLQFQPGFNVNSNEPPVWIEVTGTSPRQEPARIEFHIEAKANTVGIDQTIQVFNFVSDSFVEVDSRAATLNDSVVSVSLAGELSQYVNAADGTVKARLSWNGVGPLFLYPWQISIDKINWTITP